MRVTVRLFAALRERAGRGRVELDLPSGALARDAWGALALGDLPAGCAYAVNGTYAAGDTALGDGDEVAVIPPVSGGAPLVSLQQDALDLGELVALVADPGAGGIATFLGTVRDNARERQVLYLEYEAYDGMAEAEMARIAEAVVAAHGCIRCAIRHRVGKVEIGEASVAVAVSSPHRAEALAACKDAIDTLKTTVPIWKREVYVGGEEWIGQGA